MANVSRPNGFTPVKRLGSVHNIQTNKYVVTAGDTTALYVGDLVVQSAGPDPSGSGYPCVTRAAASATGIVGVVVGFEPDPLNLNTPVYRAASTLRVLRVADDPDLVFQVESNGTNTAGDVGMNINVTADAGSTITGASGMRINSSTTTTLNTMSLTLVGFVDTPNNDITAANAKWLVRINNHKYRSATGSQGV